MKRNSKSPNFLTQKRQKVGKPRLRQNVRLELLKYAEHADEFEDCMLNYSGNLKRFERCLMINHRYLDLLFEIPNQDDNPSTRLRVQDNEIGIEEFFGGTCRAYYGTNSDVLINFVRLANYKSLMLDLVHFQQFKMNDEGQIQVYVKLCRAMKDNPSLTTLFVKVDMISSQNARFYVEHLPDKIHFLYSRFDLSPLLKYRKSLIQRWKLDSLKSNLYYAQIFQARTTHLDLVSVHWKLFHHDNLYLYKLAECGPFKPNSELETLRIAIDFGAFYFFELDDPLESKWENKQLPKYRLALKYLKELNPNLKLQLYSGSCDRTIQCADDIITKLEKTLNRAKTIIDCAVKCGLQIEYIKFENAEVYITSDDFDDVCEEIAGKLKLTYYKDEIDGTIEYKGTKIELNQPVEPYDNDETINITIGD